MSAAAVWAFTWVHGLFLFVVSIPAAGVVLLVVARMQDHLDANRAAALAVAAPTGIGDSQSLERIVVSDLAAASLGDPGVIHGAISLAESTIEDPWRRALAIERLERAKESAEAMPILPALTLCHAGWRRIPSVAAALAAASIAAIVATRHHALLAPLGLSFVAFTLAAVELRRSQGLRLLLVHEAAAEPARGRVLVPDERVIEAIRSLTRRRRVTTLAARIANLAPEPDRTEALRRLRAAEPCGRSRATLERDVAVFAAAAAVLIPLAGTL